MSHSKRCLFCREYSEKSRSVEHILPESLGNRSHVLPAKVVCDSCNNYFSRKVEKPFLESGAIRLLRFEQAIPSKRGKIPKIPGVILPTVPVEIERILDPGYPRDGTIDIIPRVSGPVPTKGTLIVPAEANEPTDIAVSRFLAKVALEAMAFRLKAYPEGFAYLVDEPQLNLIRNHARRGHPRNWPFHIRRIYDANKVFTESGGAQTQIVHEFDILKTEWGEWFFVLAIFGVELVINFGGPHIEGYQRWLKENSYKSPLYQ